jgi:hypothetical protein
MHGHGASPKTPGAGRPDKRKLPGAEIFHHARDRPDIAGTPRANENDAQIRHHRNVPLARHGLNA